MYCSYYSNTRGVIESESNSWGYAPSLCVEVWWQMGQVPTVGRVLLEQQLLGESHNGTLWSSVWPPMQYTFEHDWAWWEDNLWAWLCHWGWTYSPSHSSIQFNPTWRPSRLNKKAWVWNRRPRVPSCVTHVRCEEIWDQRLASKALDRPISHLGQAGECGILFGAATIIGGRE
jgi:hypothetical protein